jgi:hypothetical protein
MKRFLITSGVMLLLVCGAMGGLAQSAFADSSTADICTGATGSANCSSSGPSLTNVVSATINILSLLVGIAAVIMIIVAGFRYVTSGGDSGKVSGAKDAIIYAVVGLIIAGFSQAIVRLVLHKTGIN